jgi:hypothetical protein
MEAERLLTQFFSLAVDMSIDLLGALLTDFFPSNNFIDFFCLGL